MMFWIDNKFLLNQYYSTLVVYKMATAKEKKSFHLLGADEKNITSLTI